jgi:hypothetical protein
MSQPIERMKPASTCRTQGFLSSAKQLNAAGLDQWFRQFYRQPLPAMIDPGPETYEHHHAH